MYEINENLNFIAIILLAILAALFPPILIVAGVILAIWLVVWTVKWVYDLMIIDTSVVKWADDDPETPAPVSEQSSTYWWIAIYAILLPAVIFIPEFL